MPRQGRNTSSNLDWERGRCRETEGQSVACFYSGLLQTTGLKQREGRTFRERARVTQTGILLPYWTPTIQSPVLHWCTGGGCPTDRRAKPCEDGLLETVVGDPPKAVSSRVARKGFWPGIGKRNGRGAGGGKTYRGQGGRKLLPARKRRRATRHWLKGF